MLLHWNYAMIIIPDNFPGYEKNEETTEMQYLLWSFLHLWANVWIHSPTVDKAIHSTYFDPSSTCGPMYEYTALQLIRPSTVLILILPPPVDHCMNTQPYSW